MLVSRVLTALVLQGMLLCTLFAFDHLWWFIALLSVVFGLLAWEWSGLVGIRHTPARIFYALAVYALGVALCTSVIGLGVIWWLLLPSVLCWYWYVGWFMNYPAAGPYRHMKVRAALGALILPSAMYGLCTLTTVGVPQGSWLVFAVAMAVSSLDVGSYFGGKWWGKTPMASHISPNKTIGGVISGVITCVVITALFGWGWWHYTGHSEQAIWLMLALLGTMPFSIGGDLLVSMLKREAKVKDSGGILPGHGGMLDRLDGVVAAVPPGALLLLWTGLI